jgi:RHS repeat-associated protein
MGRVASENKVTANVTKTTSYLYNLDGSVQSISYPSTRSINYTYSGAERALSAIDPTGPINYFTSAKYAPHGAPATYINGFVPGGFPGIMTTDFFNSRLQPCRLSARSAGSAPSQCTDNANIGNVMDLRYDFHPGSGDNGNVYQIVNNRDGNRTQNFLYDSLNRIQQAYTNGPKWGETFGPTATSPGTPPSTSGIDAWGNLTNRSGVTGKTSYEGLSCPANSNNQLMTCSLTYDAAGNVTSDGSLGYTYDLENGMTKFVTSVTDIYVYDGDGQRVKKNASGVTLYWNGATGNVLDETDGTGTLVSEYIYVDGKRVARRDADNSVKYYISDNLGSASVITSSQGVMPPLAESDYYPYGGEIVITPGDSNHYKFTGKERDSESGLDNFGARYYASSMGRFMKPDPLYLELHRLVDPQQWNLYSYVRNNPLSLTDPTGLYITCTGDRCKDYLAALAKDVSFKVKYDDNGKVVADVDKGAKLSKSDKAFLKAIGDTKNHVTINAVGGKQDSSVFFGASHGSTHTINFDQAALLDSSKNAGGMTSAGLVGHETLEGYDEAKGNSMAEGHDWAASLGFPGFDKATAGSAQVQNGMVIGLTGTFHVQGTSINEQIQTQYVTPIPQADFLQGKGLPAAGYPVSVEKQQ